MGETRTASVLKCKNTEIQKEIYTRRTPLKTFFIFVCLFIFFNAPPLFRERLFASARSKHVVKAMMFFQDAEQSGRTLTARR
jgi:hypothetical protein